MLKQTGFKTHLMLLCAMMILGQSISVFPIRFDENAVFHYLFSFITGLFFMLITSFATKKFFSLKRNTPLKKAVCVIVYLRIAVYSLVTFADCLFDFKHVIKKILFFGSDLIGVLMFCATVLYFLAHRQENILKFSLISAVVCLAVVLFFSVFLFENYHFKNLYIKELPDIKTAASGVIPLLRKAFLPTGLLYFYKHFTGLCCRKGVLIKGYILGGIFLSVALLCPILIFGTEFIGRLEFPFNSAVTTLSIGRLFSRLDGIMYVVYFVAALLKSVVCIFVGIKSLKEVAIILGIKKSTAKSGKNPLFANRG